MTMRDRILEKTNDGLKIFTHYVGEDVKKKTFCNPFRGDTSPSCKLYYRKKNGTSIYYMVDYGDSDWCGDCFSIAAKINHLDIYNDFPELLKLINKDLDLALTDDAPIKEHKVIEKNASQHLPSSMPLKFRATYQNFHEWELKYWLRYGITKEILEKYQVKSINACTFFRSDGSSFTIHGTYMEPMYGYLFNNGTGIKVYRPFSKLRFMYAGNLPKPYVFGRENLSTATDQKYILLTGGEKDVMTLSAHGFTAIALNSESARLTEDMMLSLSQRYQHIIFAYDCDETGKRESQQRVSEYKDRYSVHCLVLPLSGKKKEKDVSDFFALGHSSEEYQELINETIIIKTT